ncbi:MAG: CotH kinase family protein, partial [Verrucomicrobiota bacterium]
QDFFTGPVQVWELTLPEASRQALRESPRDYAPARVRIGSEVFEEVGVHLKGSAGSKRSVDDRPSMTLKFNRYRPGRRAFGLEKLHLNNSVQDGSYLNQNLASRVYRAAGIPLTRSTHALLRVNGQDQGVYVVVESYDADYVRRNFPGAGWRRSNLYDCGFIADIDRNLQRDAGEGPADWADLKRLREAVNQPLKLRKAALEQVLDVDRFRTLVAIQMTLDDWDGYVRNRNNYRICFPAGDGRAVFLPSGLDQLLRHPEAPVRDAWTGRVAQALFEIPGESLQLRARMRELSQSWLSEAWLTNQLGQLQARLDAAVAARPEGMREPQFPDRWNQMTRVRQRLQVVARELADWPDPLPPLAPGTRLQPAPWTLLVQTGKGRGETTPLAGIAGKVLHLVAEAEGTRASFRAVVTVPAGEYRWHGRAKTRGVEPFEDQFGRGAALRMTGSTAAQRLEGDTDWTTLQFEFEQREDGPVELIVELRANRGEAWFDLGSLALEAR